MQISLTACLWNVGCKQSAQGNIFCNMLYMQYAIFPVYATAYAVSQCREIGNSE